MDIIFSEATRKLQLVRRARRLFDLEGHEIFRSEDIQRDMEYYVSCGENFINPLKAVKSELQYRFHSEWTIYGIERWYKILRQRRKPSPTSSKIPKSPDHEDKQTQTRTVKRTRRHKHKNTQKKENIRPPIQMKPKHTQTEEKISTPILLKPKYTQTEEMISSPTQLEPKYTQTEEKIRTPEKRQNKETSTQTQPTTCANKETSVNIVTSHLECKKTQTQPAKGETKATQTITMCENKAIQTGIDPKLSIPTGIPIYSRPTRTTNFRVKVYRNGERGRFDYCKSCSMDILFSAATQKLQMPTRARRLFDCNGLEIYHAEEIRRDMEYYVSSGKNFKQPIRNS
ncbi:hypothetical protein I4U23_022327 [Adineta vaga]|nr:hypothetical protein I4U23_022327 [Adineta vaga]